MTTTIGVDNTASLEASVTDDHHDNSDHHENTNQPPKSIQLIEKPHELDATTIEMANSDVMDHMGSYSVPVSPVKPYQSSSRINDNDQHPPLLPRRSHSYEHLEEVGLSPIQSPPNQSGSGGFRFRGNMLASVGSSSDVLGEWCALFRIND